MHSERAVTTVLSLVAEGLNDCEISRRTGIPRATILDWRHGRTPQRTRSTGGCPICAKEALPPPERHYAYLLGIYLGDGCISRGPRTYRMRICLDSRYPRIVSECAAALEAMRPGKHATITEQRSRCVVVSMYWNHWPCLFPQHGPGRKHLRPIILQSWQNAIVDRQREAFIRGLIHSDGCRVVANDRGVSSIRYHFSNLSDDIKALYCASLDALEIPWTRPSAQQIAVYRKDATAAMDRFVGPKS